MLIREAAKKAIFLSGPATKALAPSPSLVATFFSEYIGYRYTMFLKNHGIFERCNAFCFINLLMLSISTTSVFMFIYIPYSGIYCKNYGGLKVGGWQLENTL